MSLCSLSHHNVMHVGLQQVPSMIERTKDTLKWHAWYMLTPYQCAGAVKGCNNTRNVSTSSGDSRNIWCVKLEFPISSTNETEVLSIFIHLRHKHWWERVKFEPKSALDCFSLAYWLAVSMCSWEVYRHVWQWTRVVENTSVWLDVPDPGIYVCGSIGRLNISIRWEGMAHF